MGIYEVEIMLGLTTAIDIYVAEYEKRYKVKPVFQNKGADETVLKDLIRAIGLDKTCDAIRTYLKMSEPWFLTKGHSLKVLQDNINVVNAKAAKTPSQTGKGAVRVLIQKERVFCDKCHAPATKDWVGTVEDLQKPRFCETCQTA